jgi:hypothetical protein
VASQAWGMLTKANALKGFRSQNIVNLEEALAQDTSPNYKIKQSYPRGQTKAIHQLTLKNPR